MKRAVRSLTTCLLLAAAPLTVTANAYAADPTPQELKLARKLFEEGIAFEKSNEYSAALERFRRVATVKSSPSLKYHTGFCEEKLGHLVLALSFYEQAEADATEKQNLEVLGAVKAPLAGLTAKVPKLVPVVTDAPDLEVSIDGKPIPKGLWGLEIRVEPGRHTVEGKAPSYVPFSQTLDFPDGSRLEVKVHVDLANGKSGVVAAVPSPVASATPAPTSTPPTSTAPAPSPNNAPASPSSSPSRGPAILATAGAVVLIGGGFASFVYSGSLADDAKTKCLTLPSCDDKKGGHSPLRHARPHRLDCGGGSWRDRDLRVDVERHAVR